MKAFISFLSRVFLIALVFSLAVPVLGQQSVIDFSHALHWRSIGPFRGGRTRAIAGIPNEPNTFYMAPVNGGLWKTVDAGRTWLPVFDHEPTGSIGAIALAPSNPDIVYVGSGEGLHRPDLSVGDGIYKSSDGGKTWTHLGLRDGQQIRTIVVDPRDPNTLLVAVVGHPYGPNAERGIYRSTDGGENFQKVLYKDENTGGADIEVDPKNPDIIYATMWEAQEGPWENAAWEGPGGGIYKSEDGGKTWHQIATDLAGGVSQANLAIAPSDPNRMYAAIADAKGAVKVYRSDDGGNTWMNPTDDPRPAVRIGGGDLPVPAVDPKDPNTVYFTSTVVWKSTDGGKTWTGFRGAPGGDDYQNIWINPNNPNIVFLASDQGAIVTVDDGQSWSSWYNQPTAQLYHVSADNAFPYRVCSGQQESGSVCIATRSNDGEITFRDWHPVAAEEYGYVAPDPRDPEIVYGGKLTRYNRRTGQGQDVSPVPTRSGNFRVERTEPVVFSPVDPRILYFAANTLWQTSDGGDHWKQISPDLTRKTWEVPASVGKYRNEPSAQPTQRGVIYAIAPSPLDVNRIWAGTDDGLIQLTTNGGASWTNVTPPALVPWAKVSVIEASHFDPHTAWAAINTLRLDDLRPHIYRTHDDGKTWQEIVTGITANQDVNAVREDPKRKGLLFAGTEDQVYVSFDDGDHWESLRLNMPATSVRDLLAKDDDLIAATHGRGFWILDNIGPLRQMSSIAAQGTELLHPATAMRIRWDTNSDTPLPPDVPAGENPPDGAALDYFLAPGVSGPVVLEINDSTGKLVRRFASTDPVPQIDPRLEVPDYWVRPSQALSAEPGLHRFLWDMHYAPISGMRAQYPIAAVFHNTAPAPTSPWVMPGQYTVKLTVNGQTYSQPLTVTMDPRVKTPVQGLRQQFELSMQLYQAAEEMSQDLTQVESALSQIEQLKGRANGEAQRSLDDLNTKLIALKGATGFRRRGGGGQPQSLTAARNLFVGVMSLLQGADVAPTAAMVQTTQVQQYAPSLHQQWQSVRSTQIPQVNAQLRSAGLSEIRVQ
ncbi:MAG TPA: glycoside hydrolase [Terriglobales bacterium]|nr:glycoside hydrolase [Terriglobales bacterium]